MEDQPQALSKTLTTTASSGIRRAWHAPASGRSGPISVAVWATGAPLLTAPDLDGIVEIFTRRFAARLAYTSLVYQHDGQGVVYSLGAPARHSLRYRMRLGDDPLGELSITRERPFSDEDISWLENQICGLVYVLHNALSYRQALAFSDEKTGAIHSSPVLPD